MYWDFLSNCRNSPLMIGMWEKFNLILLEKARGIYHQYTNVTWKTYKITCSWMDPCGAPSAWLSLPPRPHLSPLCHDLLGRAQFLPLAVMFPFFLWIQFLHFKYACGQVQVSFSSIDNQRGKISLYPDSGHEGRSWPHLFEIFILEHVHCDDMGKVSALNEGKW